MFPAPKDTEYLSANRDVASDENPPMLAYEEVDFPVLVLKLMD